MAFTAPKACYHRGIVQKLVEWLSGRFNNPMTGIPILSELIEETEQEHPKYPAPGPTLTGRCDTTLNKLHDLSNSLTTFTKGPNY